MRERYPVVMSLLYTLLSLWFTCFFFLKIKFDRNLMWMPTPSLIISRFSREGLYVCGMGVILYVLYWLIQLLECRFVQQTFSLKVISHARPLTHLNRFAVPYGTHSAPPFPFDPLPSSCLTPEHELLMSNELHQDNGAPPINAERQESFHFLSNVCNPINHHQQQQATLFWRRKPTSSQTMKTCQSSSSSKPSKAISAERT